jgi:hypothetical protein
MAKGITPYSINAPGFQGLNKQESNLDINAGFATEAMNCVIDKYGRVGARKGYLKRSATSAALFTNNLPLIGELITNDGTSYILCTGGDKLYKFTGGALIELTYGGGGVAPTINANNWQFSSLNGNAYFFQRGYNPLMFDPAVSTTTYMRVSEHASASGTVQDANTVLSAYGRLWTADTLTDKNTVAFSDLLYGYKWNGGSSGTLNLVGVWPHGADEIVTLAAHNNFLIIFGKRQILVYQGANTPSTMTLYDTVANIGCTGRDTVQNVGNDLFFLSNSGVRSFMRTIQEKSMPLRDLSKNIRDHLLDDLDQETMDNVKSCFFERDSFYMLSLPQTRELYVFDTRHPLEDGAARVTTFTNLEPTSFCITKDNNLYFGRPGYLCEYTGYIDDTNSYVMKYYTGYLSFDGGSISSILKKMMVTLIGGSGQTVNFKYAFDYSTNFQTESAQIETGYIAYYGVSLYNQPTTVYSSGIFTDIASIQAGGAGKVAQFGFEATVNNAPLSIQRIDIFTKSGKIL